MTKNLALAVSFYLAVGITASGQNMAPVVTTPIAPFTVYAGAPARSIDLTTGFADPDASNAVQFSVLLPSSTGTFNIALDGHHKPITVANFLSYVNSGRYFMTDPTTHTLGVEFCPSFRSWLCRARRWIYRDCGSNASEQCSTVAGHYFPGDSKRARHLQQKRHHRDGKSRR